MYGILQLYTNSTTIVIFLDNLVIILKVVTRKSIVKTQINTYRFHSATVTTSYKFKEIQPNPTKVMCCDSIMSFNSYQVSEGRVN